MLFGIFKSKAEKLEAEIKAKKEAVEQAKRELQAELELKKLEAQSQIAEVKATLDKSTLRVVRRPHIHR